jgi:hypothetical protein
MERENDYNFLLATSFNIWKESECIIHTFHVDLIEIIIH